MNTRLLAILFIISVIVVSGCTQTDPDTVNEQNSNSDAIINEQDNPQEESEIVEEEKMVEDLTKVCDKITDSDFKNVCYAIAKTDESYCENVKVSSGDRENYGANWCKYYVLEAIKKEKEPGSDSVLSEYLSGKCEEILADPESSNNPQIDFDYCYYERALETNNSKDCEKVVGETYKDLCFYKLSYNTQNPDLCNLITDSDKKESCKSVSEMGYENVESCLEHESWVDQSDCLVDFAVASSNPDICEMDEEGVPRDHCYYGVTEETKESHCEKIEDEYNRDRCWVYIGGVTGDPKICEEKALGTEYYGIKEDLEWFRDIIPGKDICYKNVAVYHRDVSYCENAYYKDACYNGYVFGIVLEDHYF